jgi:hypothetical protein
VGIVVLVAIIDVDDAHRAATDIKLADYIVYADDGHR